MSAATMKKAGADASRTISEMSGDNEMSCLNLRIMLDSIIDSLDGLSDDLPESGKSMTAVHARFNAIYCYVSCSKRMVQDVLESSLAMTNASRGVSA